MSPFEFLDKHWGFWFAVFLLCLANAVAQTVVALCSLMVKLLRG
jgi:hypothetical protein